MKVCTKCKQKKEETEFNKRWNTKDGLQHQCRECEKANHRTHYAQNKQTYVANAKSRRKKNRERYEAWRSTLSCTICGESDSVCIDLHHTDPSTKEYSVAQIGKNGMWQKFLREIQKCIVVCSNCHRKIHHYGIQNMKT